MKRPISIILALAIFAVAALVYFATRPPPGVAPMGDGDSETIAWISLAIAILSLATAVVGLIQKVIELRASKGS